MTTTVQRGGFPVFERRFGEGRDRAVLLHCALAHSSSWSRLAGELGDRLTMIAPDMPGHGRSAPWDQRCGILDQVAAIALDCLGQGGHLIGHSFGAVVALDVALKHPAAVKSLTLIEPVLFAAAQDSDPDVFKAYLADAETFADPLKQADWDAAAQAFTNFWGDNRPWQDVPRDDRVRFASQMHFIRETEGVLSYDEGGLLSPGHPEKITCPTLMIRGGDTHPVMSAIHQTLGRRIRQATDIVIPNAGHMAPITHPVQVARHIRSVLDAA